MISGQELRPFLDLKESEFPQLQQSEVYLDHAGAPLVPQSVLLKYTQDLSSQTYGNPHSSPGSPSAQKTHERMSRIRHRILQ